MSANVLARPLAAADANKWLIAVAVAAGALLEVIDSSIVNVALNDMQAALGATLSQISWVISSYGIANIIILPLGAWLGQRFGKKDYFLFSMVGFTAASVLCGLATSLPLLVIARIVQGLTGGGLMAKAQAILLETFPKEEHGTAMALFGAIVIAGPALGPPLGGWITTNLGWRWIFFINLPFGIVATLLVMAFLPTDTERNADGRVDWTAIAALAAGIGCLQAFFEEGNSEGWFDSHLIVALAIVATIGLVTFIWRTLRSDAPVVNLKVLQYRSLSAGCILAAIIGMALSGAMFAVPIFAQSILHFSAQQTGLMMLPGALVSAVTMPLGRLLMQKVEPRLALFGGTITMIVALVLLSQLSPLTSGEDLFWPLVIRSVGTSLMFMPLQLLALGSLPRAAMADATGIFSLTRQFGGSIGVALLTTMLDWRQAFHLDVLAEKFVANDPATVDRLQALSGAMMAKGYGAGEAQRMALSTLHGAIAQQAMVMSFNDTFWATGALILLLLPLLFFFQKPQEGVQIDAGH